MVSIGCYASYVVLVSKHKALKQIFCNLNALEKKEASPEEENGRLDDQKTSCPASMPLFYFNFFSLTLDRTDTTSPRYDAFTRVLIQGDMPRSATFYKAHTRKWTGTLQQKTKTLYAMGHSTIAGKYPSASHPQIS
jgi:hypothetical protein